MFSPGTFSAPWAALAQSREQYCLAWEAKYLMELGNALETILSGLANMVAQEALKYTVLSGKSLLPAPSTYPQLSLPKDTLNQTTPTPRVPRDMERWRVPCHYRGGDGLCGEVAGSPPTTWCIS